MTISYHVSFGIHGNHRHCVWFGLVCNTHNMSWKCHDRRQKHCRLCWCHHFVFTVNPLWFKLHQIHVNHCARRRFHTSANIGRCLQQIQLETESEFAVLAETHEIKWRCTKTKTLTTKQNVAHGAFLRMLDANCMNRFTKSHILSQLKDDTLCLDV